MSADINTKLERLNARVEALTDILTNKPELGIDAIKIKDFIDKYSVVNSLLKNDTFTSVVNKLNELNEMIDDIKNETEVPLQVARDQSQKIINLYTSDEVELALNIADVKRFKGEIFVAFRDFITYLQNLNLDKKMAELENEIALSKEIANNFIAMQDTLKQITEDIKSEENLIKKIEQVNEEQDTQINYVNNLITILEKEIESYAFFTNEFNKIYLNAKEFMTRFAEALETLEEIEKRDNALYEVTEHLLNAFTADYSSLESSITDLKTSVKNVTSEMLSWLNDSLLFVNEVKAYNLSLNGYNQNMQDIIKECADIDKLISSISV